MSKLLHSEMTQILVIGAIILFGALVNALTPYTSQKKDKEPFNVSNFIISMIVASFSGVMVGLLAYARLESIILVLVCSGMGAVLGMEVINAMSKAFLSFVTKLLEKLTT